MNSIFLEGFRNKIYFVVCPLCKGGEDINCEICFNERSRRFYIPAVPLKSITIVWADSAMERDVYFQDGKGMFSIELDAVASKSLTDSINESEEVENIFIPGNPGKHKNEFVIEMNELGKK